MGKPFYDGCLFKWSVATSALLFTCRSVYFCLRSINDCFSVLHLSLCCPSPGDVGEGPGRHRVRKQRSGLRPQIWTSRLSCRVRGEREKHQCIIITFRSDLWLISPPWIPWSHPPHADVQCADVPPCVCYLGGELLWAFSSEQLHILFYYPLHREAYTLTPSVM